MLKGAKRFNGLYRGFASEQRLKAPARIDNAFEGGMIRFNQVATAFVVNVLYGLI